MIVDFPAPLIPTSRALIWPFLSWLTEGGLETWAYCQPWKFPQLFSSILCKSKPASRLILHLRTMLRTHSTKTLNGGHCQAKVVLRSLQKGRDLITAQKDITHWSNFELTVFTLDKQLLVFERSNDRVELDLKLPFLQIGIEL